MHTIREQRKRLYHQDGQNQVETEEAALEFFNEMGFCLFSSTPDVELPSRADKHPDLWG